MKKNLENGFNPFSFVFLRTVPKKTLISLYKTKNKKDTDKLFLSNKRTKINTSSIRRFIKKAYIEAGIDSTTYSVHTLRHTCATLMFKNGTDIKTIQEILGHSTVDVTKIYTHLYDKEVEQAMQGHPLSKFKYKDALAYAVA